MAETKSRRSISINPTLREDIELLAEHKYRHDRGFSTYISDVMHDHVESQAQVLSDLRKKKMAEAKMRKGKKRNGKHVR